MTRPWSSVVCRIFTRPSTACTATLGAGSRVSPNTILIGTSTGVVNVSLKSPVKTGPPSWSGWGSRVVAAYIQRSGKPLALTSIRNRQFSGRPVNSKRPAASVVRIFIDGGAESRSLRASSVQPGSRCQPWSRIRSRGSRGGRRREGSLDRRRPCRRGGRRAGIAGRARSCRSPRNAGRVAPFRLVSDVRRLGEGIEPLLGPPGEAEALGLAEDLERALVAPADAYSAGARWGAPRRGTRNGPRHRRRSRRFACNRPVATPGRCGHRRPVCRRGRRPGPSR